ncbi:TetR family transcriptional regulator [Pseudorhodoplanes sinuspersici]|nr:TetR family transcriptional regulator [Pseudorhodoplanes sinuspersici]
MGTGHIRKAVTLPTAPRPRSVLQRNGNASAKQSERRPRDAAATSDRILEAAISEFAEHGYAGARIDAIAQRADANMRMLYHYFGSKNDLYLCVLEKVFERIRLKEQKLNLKSLAPLPAMMKLFDFTYEHFASNPLFIRILINENLLGGRHLSRSVRVSSLSSPLLVAMKEALRRGEAEGVFRRGIDPLQLYVSMVAMSYFHISNGPTLSHLFSANLSAGRWRNERRRHASEMLKAYLTSGLTS